MPPVLNLNQVVFAYRAGQPVISDFSAQLHPGRVCAMIGPNAAGKSTLMKLMLGQLSTWSGQVTIDGTGVDSMPPGVRAGMLSYVPQRAGISFAFSVEEIVGMGRFALPHDPVAVERAIEECDLSLIRHEIVSQLSFGQQQRVLLARAMAQASGNGKAMLLDEPGSAMDLWHVHQMMNSLTRLASQGLAVLIILHDLNLAARYADDVWLIHEGRLVASGPWNDILKPSILEPVYRVKIDPLPVPGEQRPVFHIRP